MKKRNKRPAVSLLDFLQTYRITRLNLAPKSLSQMAVTVVRFSGFLGHPATLADLTEESLRGFLADYRTRWAAASTNSKRCQLLALWRCACDEDMLPALPNSRRIPRAQGRITIPEAWTVDEFGEILGESRRVMGRIAGIPARLWWHSLLLVAYDTGERRGALLEAAPVDLSLGNKSIVFVKTKTGNPRWCGLMDETMAAVQAIYDPKRERIWPWPYSREALEGRFRTILRHTGVRYGRGQGGLFHKIRRTAGTLVEANGGDGCKFLGNSHAIFMKHYRDPRFIATDLSFLPRPPVLEDKPMRMADCRQASMAEFLQNDAIDVEGSLWRFLHHVYVPECLEGCKPESVEQHVVAVRRLCRFADRSVLLSELSDRLLQRHLSWILENGAAVGTAESARNHLVAQWRHAHRKGLIDFLPDVAKIDRALHEAAGKEGQSDE